MQILQLINRPIPARPAANGVVGMYTIVSNGLGIDIGLKADGQKPNGNDSQINENEWGEFLHLPNEKFYDFSKIRAEIVRDTEAKTGKNAGEEH